MQVQGEVEETQDMEVVMEGVPVVERLYEVCRLWAAWAKELEFEDLDIDAFGKETMSKMANGTEYHLLRIKGKTVGFLELGFHYDPAISAYVAFGERVYVVPEYRGLGVLTAVAEWLRDYVFIVKGCPQGLLEVSVENQWLREFYEAHGFEVTHLKMRRIQAVQ